MKLNTINKFIKKTRRWHKKTGLAVFQRAAAHFEEKKKAAIFSVIDRLNVQAESVSPVHQAQSRMIWICWFQGLEHAPALVKQCVESVKCHTPDANIIVLTDENIPQYLNLPEHITTKYQAESAVFRYCPLLTALPVRRHLDGCDGFHDPFVT